MFFKNERTSMHIAWDPCKALSKPKVNPKVGTGRTRYKNQVSKSPVSLRI